MLKYADYLTGRGVGMAEIGEIMLYSLFFLVPRVLPLSILIASLIAFGTLGEHNELTAIKSAGISLVKIILPVFVFVAVICSGLYFYNDYVLPKTNIRVWSLMYDIKVKKAPFSLKEGAFSGGLENYNIKVEEKSEDGKHLKGIMIYQKSEGRSRSRRNDRLTVADSGSLYMINNDQYLVLELFHGAEYREDDEIMKWSDYKNQPNLALVNSKFDHNKMVIDISELALKRTPKEHFYVNKQMKTFSGLWEMSDSLLNVYSLKSEKLHENMKPFFMYHFKVPKKDLDISGFDYNRIDLQKANVINSTKQIVNSVQSSITSHQKTLWNFRWKAADYQIQAWYRYNSCVSCLLLFLIGGCIGAIVKKGGLGVPILISVLIFVFYYILSMHGHKLSRELIYHASIGMNICNAVLLPIAAFGFYLVWKDSNFRLFKKVQLANYSSGSRDLYDYKGEATDFKKLRFLIHNLHFMKTRIASWKAVEKINAYVDEVTDYLAHRVGDELIRERIRQVPDLNFDSERLRFYYQIKKVSGGGASFPFLAIILLPLIIPISFVRIFLQKGFREKKVAVAEFLGYTLLNVFWLFHKYNLDQDYRRSLQVVCNKLGTVEMLHKASA